MRTMAPNIAPQAYDMAVDLFCRSLGLRTPDVMHLAVGPNFARARCVVRDPMGRVVRDANGLPEEAEVVVTRNAT